MFGGFYINTYEYNNAISRRIENMIYKIRRQDYFIHIWTALLQYRLQYSVVTVHIVYQSKTTVTAIPGLQQVYLGRDLHHQLPAGW